METVFGKAFVHETENGFVTYNCYTKDGGFGCDDLHLKEWVVYSNGDSKVILNGKEVSVTEGINIIEN
jgi:hypothetical protein